RNRRRGSDAVRNDYKMPEVRKSGRHRSGKRRHGGFEPKPEIVNSGDTASCVIGLDLFRKKSKPTSSETLAIKRNSIPSRNYGGEFGYIRTRNCSSARERSASAK